MADAHPGVGHISRFDSLRRRAGVGQVRRNYAVAVTAADLVESGITCDTAVSLRKLSKYFSSSMAARCSLFLFEKYFLSADSLEPRPGEVGMEREKSF